jgi:hypothetical protein
MTEPRDSAEPLQILPPGLPRGYAEYTPADAVAPAAPPTNVGGYDELVAYFHARGQALPREREGLAAIDHLIDGASDKESLSVLARSIGMFYGDVLTHIIPGAHWEVIEEGYPRVRVTRTTAVDVVRVAIGRLATGNPTLLQNSVHVLEFGRQEP